MRSAALIVWLLVGCTGGPDGPRADGKHQSALGFAASIPESWLILDGVQIRENPELFAGVFESPGFEGADPQLLEQMRANIEAGSVEFYYPDRANVSDFSENVNVQKGVGRLPGDDSELQEVCPVVETELSRGFGRPIVLEACELRPVGSGSAFFIQAEGAVPGTMMMQYQLQKSTAVTLVVTATVLLDSSSALDVQLDELVQSIEF
ncbi:MAG: hypothetical protein AAGM22_08385 [Acidobacteriota bacterium]